MRRVTFGLLIAWLFVSVPLVRGAEGGLVIPTDPIGLISTLGLPMACVIALVLEIVVPGRRLTKVEAQRDEAIGGWKAQTTATTDVASVTKEILPIVKRVDERVQGIDDRLKVIEADRRSGR